MSLDTLAAIVEKALEQVRGGVCTFSFQGGEPTLRGLDFFRELVAMQKEGAARAADIHNAIQTNGQHLDGEWAAFFRENNFLVGISLDGPRRLHDKYRKDGAGRGSFARTMAAVELLRENNVMFNVLTVVTRGNAGQAGSIYNFFAGLGICYQQYIPCHDPLFSRGNEEYSLTPKEYAGFLKELFMCYLSDLYRNKPVSIQYFDDLLHMLLGAPPLSCCRMGHCSRQYVVEANGDVYPCDFYCLDEYRLGNLAYDSFAALDARREELGFIANSREIADECRSCKLYYFCRSGCMREREKAAGGLKSCYCEAYKEFLPFAVPRLQEYVMWRRGQSAKP